MTDSNDIRDDDTEETGTKAAPPAEQSHDESTLRPAVVDESQYEGEDDDEDDDDVPMHFGAVAQAEDAAAPGDKSDEALPTPAADAEIPLHLIDKDALWVVKRLQAKGYEAYLTGGCVRDLLLGRTPKDFDVATAAHPNQVRAVFRNCRLVGRRFRLAHVFFPSGKVIETATFRANPTDELEDLPSDLLVERDNVFGNVEQDARRRDLTVNGLFYDPLKGKVLDFVNGRTDLEAKLIRTIGNPEVRFQEDPVRILRAIKFATRLGFEIEDATYQAMRTHVAGLTRCAPARLQEELLRLLTSGHARTSMRLCEEIGVLDVILPEIAKAREMVLEAAEPVALPGRAQPAPVPVPLPGAESEAGTETPTETPAEMQTEAPIEAVAVAPAPEPEPLRVPTAEERHLRFGAMLDALDAVKARDVDLTSALVFAALLTPAWEAMAGTTTSFATWFEEVATGWTDRLRLTRHDRERVPMLLEAQADLAPHRRRGAHARSVVHRASFREALLLLTMRAQASGGSFEEIALWKAVARAHNASYTQQRVSERGPRQRTAAVQHGGGGGGGGGSGPGGHRGGRRRRRR
jgi:poly(A) polymerase